MANPTCSQLGMQDEVLTCKCVLSENVLPGVNTFIKSNYSLSGTTRSKLLIYTCVSKQQVAPSVNIAIQIYIQKSELRIQMCWLGLQCAQRYVMGHKEIP